MAGMSWFHTSRGKMFSMGCMAAASCATFGVQFFPHTFFVNKYKDVVSMYESAVPVPLTEVVLKRWDKTLKDLSLPPHEIQYLKPFTVFGFDLFRAGSIGSRWGAIIGIPTNYNYTDSASVDTDKIRVNNETVNWNRNDAQQLLEALVLSEEAQCYGIAREVLMVRHETPLILGVIGAFSVSSTYMLCRLMNQRLNLLDRPMPVRGIFYILGSIVTYGLWAMQKDLLNSMWEREADEHIAQLDKSYSRGGVEFYTKMLKRNIALRTLLGSNGENIYTPNGNERQLFRQSGLPLEARKEFFKQHLHSIRTKQELLEEDVIPTPA